MQNKKGISLKEAAQQLAKERACIIVSQMGGINKLKAMVNAKNFQVTECGMIFMFSGSKKFNTCKVELNGLDYYDMTFGQITSKTHNLEKNQVKDVDCDSLITTFEDVTGLYLSL